PAGFRRVRSAPCLADDEQPRFVATAERTGEGAAIDLRGRQHLTALADTDTVPVPDVGVPDGPLVIEADAVRMVARRLRPDSPVSQAPVAGDVVGGDPARVGLGDGQSRTVSADRHAVG